MQHELNSTEEALALCWDLLEKAPHKHKDPFYLPAIATVDEDRASLRTVVLRKAARSDRTLWFFTDIRAAKISQIRSTGWVDWLFWNPRKLIQLRIRSRATIHHLDALALEQWEQVTPGSRKNYSSLQPPGTRLSKDAPIYPADGSLSEPSKEEMDAARQNFALVSCRADHIDLLHLHPEGHQRIELVWEKDRWEGSWLVP